MWIQNIYTIHSAVFTWTNLLVVVVELDGSESEALDLVALVTSAVLEEHHLVVGVVVVVDPGVVPINSRGEKQRMHLRDGFLADQLDPIYVAYNMWAENAENALSTERKKTGIVVSSRVFTPMSTRRYSRFEIISCISNFYSFSWKSTFLWRKWNILQGLNVFLKRTSSLNNLYSSFVKRTRIFKFFISLIR